MFYISVLFLLAGAVGVVLGLVSAIFPQHHPGEKPIAVESITLSLYLLILGVVVAL